MKTQTFDNVWDAIADTPGEAANLRVRSELMIQIRQLIKDRGLTQARAAKLFGVTPPRVSDLMRGKVQLFSIDSLINMLAAADVQTHISLAA